MADCKRKTANLFDAWETVGVLKNDGTIDNSSTYANYRTTDYIPVEEGSYTFSLDNIVYEQYNNTSSRYAFYDEDKVFINYDISLMRPARFEWTFTAPSNAKYVRLTGRISDDNIMLNTGSTALPYEPYGWLHSLRKLGTATDTITTLPADLYADGNNATVGLVGNMSQTGTPTPQNPIQPSETGERTGNLFDYTVSESGTITSTGVLEPNASCWRSTIYYEVDETKTYRASKAKDTIRICYYDSSKTFISREQITSENNKIITIPSGTKYIKWTLYASAGLPDLAAVEAMKIMLSEGSEIISYEPYGYKLDIKSANTTTPVYLGEVESTRRVKKYEFTGQENWGTASGNFYLGTIENDYLRGQDINYAICSHYPTFPQTNLITNVPDKNVSFSYATTTQRLYLVDSSFNGNLTDFTTYLQQQYAAGTPVTVWYVLSSATTGVVNEPLRKIGDYADTVSGITIPTITGKDTFDVLTTLKPSEVELTYTGWHDASVKESDGSEWQ